MTSMRKKLLGATTAAALAAAGVGVAQQAEVAPTREVGQYAGVTPGAGTPPRAGAVARARPAKLLTWPGFQAQPGGASRFFLQVSAPVETQVRTSAGRVEVVLKNVRGHLRNTFRPLDTRFFQTPVRRAKVERRRNDLVLVFDLRAEATPTVTSAPGEAGFHFVYVDFPAGQWVAETAPARGSSEPSESRAMIRIVDEGQDESDEDR